MGMSAVDRVLAETGVQFAYLFGSRATGRYRLDSDADIAIMPGEPLDLLAEAGLADRLAQALEVSAGDLLDLQRASLVLRGRVLQEGRLLYSADESGRVAFEVRTRSEYFDFLPTQRALRDQFLRRVAAGGTPISRCRARSRCVVPPRPAAIPCWINSPPPDWSFAARTSWSSSGPPIWPSATTNNDLGSPKMISMAAHAAPRR
ncbi:MAG TPA: nucleotidyltransferase domain-containing protein [Pseudonocardiaceae bacterium]|nr:nucleotidyltransferase domain-containing protein [Pseudonocardiaceae bacterium]